MRAEILEDALIVVSDRRSDTGVLNTLRSCGSYLRSDPTSSAGTTLLLRTDVGVICRVAEDRDHREAVFVLWTGARFV